MKNQSGRKHLMIIYILNGPNLNLLGLRDNTLYGTLDLKTLENHLIAYGKERNIKIKCFQSNHEGVLIDWLHQAHFDKVDGVIINAGAYTHTSYALRDAIEAISVPVVEVHLSDIYRREESFRHLSVIKEVVNASFMGEKEMSYEKAIGFLYNKNM